MPMLGALIIPSTLEEMRKFNESIEYNIKKKRCIVIYPEAHVWPYCNFIRTYPNTSFRYPVVLNAPSYCMTTTYQKKSKGNKPKITVYIDGPFDVNIEGSVKEKQNKLHKEIYECMIERSKVSTYEYIKYVKKEN